MKHSILILFFLSFFGIQNAQAKIRIGKSENLKVVHDFPNTEEYMSNPGRFMDLGILYETFNIFGMPLWVTKDPIIIGLENHNTTVYFDFEEEEVTSILEEHNLNKETLTALSFFDKHLGLLVVVIVLGAYLLYKKFLTKEDSKLETIEAKKKDSETV
ncbi:MAG: hypothetical protein ABI295_01245 [Xanthomarina sp.]